MAGSNDYERAKTYRSKNEYLQTTYTPKTRRRWPPPPMVEDENVSLSREHSPSISGVEEGEAEVKGSVDQLPIIVEIGKEDEIVQEKPIGKKVKRSSQERSSSDESFGPDTPTDSSTSDTNDSRHRRNEKYNEKPSGFSIRDVLDGKRRPDSHKAGTGAPRLPERPKATLNTPTSPTFQRSVSSRDVRTGHDSTHLYPGTLEELKANPREREYLGYAQRQRTMSGSNNAADHRPANIRHMSAMGYSGESQTPSFPRDHPGMYAPPVSANSRNMPPEFRRPKERDHNAVISDSSDSEVSPAEIYQKRTRKRTISGTRPRPSGTYNNPPRPPPRETMNRSSRPSSPERRGGRTPIPSESHRKRYPNSTSKRSSPISSPTSPYPSPPASPVTTSRPGSRDGPLKVVYPTIAKKAPQAQRNSRPSSPVGGAPYTDHYSTSNLRYSSRPNSPTLHPPGESSDKNDLSRNDSQRERKDALKPTNAGSRDPSPVQVPRSSRSPKPGLRVDVQQQTTANAPKTWAMPNQEMKQRPLSSDGAGGVFVASPIVPMTAPAWGSNEPHLQAPPIKSAAAGKQAKPSKHQTRLIICPRPGFTAKYNDWWTIPQIPELDLCPDCKDSLQENGFPGSFMRSQPRPQGTQTRCDMNVSWVRIACLLILSGREKPDVLMDLMNVLGNEEQCPQYQAVTRKRWYRVYDEDADKHVSNFTVCSACVRSIRVLFPNLKGTFNSYAPSTQSPRICDLTASVLRFAKYVDLLDSISSEARHYREDPNTKKFIRMTKEFAGIRPCRRDDQFRGMPWHYIPNVPDFTICQECFIDVVLPAQRVGFTVADQINRKITMPADANAKFSCQLYSPRMRAIFDECCRNQDVASLIEHAMARVNKERELQHRVEFVRNMPEERQDQEKQILIDEWRRWE